MSRLLIWLADQGDATSFTAVIGYTIAVLLFGGVVGWIVELVRKSKEIEKLKSEIISNVGKSIVEKQACRRMLNASTKRCGEKATELIEAITNQASKAKLRKIRDAFCSELIDIAIPEFLTYFELKHLEGKAYGVEFDDFREMLADAICEMKRFRTWLDIANTPKLISNIGREPRELELRTMRDLITVAKRFPPTIRDESVKRAEDAVEELTGKSIREPAQN